jgi:hypothetical protein
LLMNTSYREPTERCEDGTGRLRFRSGIGMAGLLFSIILAALSSCLTASPFRSGISFLRRRLCFVRSWWVAVVVPEVPPTIMFCTARHGATKVGTRDSALFLQVSYTFRETLVDVLHPAVLLYPRSRRDIEKPVLR